MHPQSTHHVYEPQRRTWSQRHGANRVLMPLQAVRGRAKHSGIPFSPVGVGVGER